MSLEFLALSLGRGITAEQAVYDLVQVAQEYGKLAGVSSAAPSYRTVAGEPENWLCASSSASAVCSRPPGL